MGITLAKPTVGSDNGTWGTELNVCLDAITGATLYALRTSDGSGLTSATLADDAVLQMTLGIGTWDIEARIIVTGSANTCDLKLAWAFGGTAGTAYRGGIGPSSASTSAIASASVFQAAAGSTSAAITSAAIYGVDGTNESMIIESGTLVVTVAGLFKLQCANNSGAGTTTVKAGSRLRAFQVA